MIEATGLFLLDHVFENADISVFKILTVKTSNESLPRTKQLRERSCVGSGAATGWFTLNALVIIKSAEFGKG